MHQERSDCHHLADAELEDLSELLGDFILVLDLKTLLFLQHLLMLRVVLKSEVHFNPYGPGFNEWPSSGSRARLSDSFLSLALAELEYGGVVVYNKIYNCLQVV